MADLSVRVGPLVLSNPVILASGTCGYGLELVRFGDISKFGAITVKGLSLRPCDGNPPPRIVETACGTINSIGLENIGIEKFLNEKLAELYKLNSKIIVNFWGSTVEECFEVASIIGKESKIMAAELNVSCPNIKRGGVHFVADGELLGELIDGVKTRLGAKPLIVKLPPNVLDIVGLAKFLVQHGADILSAINTIPAMAIDWKTKRPVLGAKSGGLSGPCIKPVAIKVVYNVVQRTNIPVIGVGGISSAEDVLEFLAAGAKAVEVGTLVMTDPERVFALVSELNQVMDQNSIRSIAEYQS